MAWAYKREAEPHFSSCNAESVGPNTIFFSAVPIVVALAVQVSDIRPALIAGTVLAGVVVALGFILYWIAARRIALYLLDAAILVSLVVQLGVSYQYKDDIARCFDFILFASLAGLGLVSLLVGYPFTLQHIREAVPREAWRHPRVINTAYVTTCCCVGTLTTVTLLYLIPVAQDVWWDTTNALTIVFQVVLPIIIFLLMLLGIRLAPMGIRNHMQESQGFSAVQPMSAKPLALV